MCGNAANGKVNMEQETLARLFVQHYGKMQRVARTILYDEQAGEDVISASSSSAASAATASSMAGVPRGCPPLAMPSHGLRLSTFRQRLRTLVSR